ncbi:MAG: class I SAM-dependent methyltransferase [bacterium]|nr:class I SAM-dependent methyltransferase [bacterium]
MSSNISKPDKKLTFDFFDYKWKRVPQWAKATENIYRQWYLDRYGYKTVDGLQEFLKDKKRILEAGCGLARDSKLFAECNSSAQIVAMDQSPSALKVARETLGQFENCWIVRADITNLSGYGVFDFISCDQVMHHTPEPEHTMSNFYKHLVPGGVLNFSICRKKNEYRDLVDDLIMERARTMSPEELWKFAETVTLLGKSLHELNIKDVDWNKKKYPDIQNFIHNQVFRCWYNPDIDFELSVSSNYDWFCGNPRFTFPEVVEMMRKGLGPHKILRVHLDDAVISFSVQKTAGL